jgi:hypothetical protein
MKLIVHIQNRMLATLPPSVRRKLKLEPLDPARHRANVAAIRVGVPGPG